MIEWPWSRQLADSPFKNRPRLVAEFAPPFGVEACLAQLVAERRGSGAVEHQPFCSELVLQARVELCYVLALSLARNVDVLRDNGSYVLRQPLPCAPIGEKPEAVPHVVCERAVF